MRRQAYSVVVDIDLGFHSVPRSCKQLGWALIRYLFGGVSYSDEHKSKTKARDGIEKWCIAMGPWEICSLFDV